MREGFRISWWDRALIGIAPDWGLRRVRARAAAQAMTRHYEAAQLGRRTSGWTHSSTDANTANLPALARLRELSRDLRRNNGWARRGVEIITQNTVGWGIVPTPGPKPSRIRAGKALDLWKDWAESKSCDFDGRLNLYGLQQLVMATVVESGEALVLFQPPAPGDDLAIPLRLQVIEPDYLDTSRNGLPGSDGGQIVQGVEYDRFGRRVAYWLFTQHPGGTSLLSSQFQSRRVPADRVLHIYNVERPGQARGVPWLASAIVRLKDFDDFEDAELMQQKMGACFGAFVTDPDGDPEPLGDAGESGPPPPDSGIDELQPGHVEYLKPGRNVTFATPPTPRDSAFSARVLRRIAAGLNVTYEDLTGDYSQSNYSSSRMARLAHWAGVKVWRWQMLIPQFCQPVWERAMELAQAVRGWPDIPSANWAAPPMPMINPEVEGQAAQRLVRSGSATLFDIIAERGEDPIEHLDRIERINKELDKRGIILDSDPRKTNASGGLQSAQGSPPAAEPDKPVTSGDPADKGKDAGDKTSGDAADAGDDAGDGDTADGGDGADA